MADLLVDDGGLLDLVLADSDHVFALLPRGHAPPDECARLPRRQNLKVWGYTRVGTWMAAGVIHELLLQLELLLQPLLLLEQLLLLVLEVLLQQEQLLLSLLRVR